MVWYIVHAGQQEVERKEGRKEENKGAREYGVEVSTFPIAGRRVG